MTRAWPVLVGALQNDAKFGPIGLEVITIWRASSARQDIDIERYKFG